MTTGSAPSLPDEGQRSAVRAALDRADLTLEELWMRYFALGGEADLMEIEGFLAGLVALPPLQRDMLAHAVNERLDELTWRHRVPYARPFRQERPAAGPLAALVQVIEDGPRTPPDRLPELVALAGRKLDVEATVYVADHEQRRLVSLTSTGDPGRRALEIDSTLAGNAFRSMEIRSSDSEGGPLLWVPVQDGADRLGLLRAALPPGTDVHDPALRQQCQWLAALVGHLVASKGQYGDALERARRDRPRTVSAELLWQQLPPLTAATERFVVAGTLQPTDAVGGDAFDYALSETTVSLAVFDAMGHGLGAGLLASTALAAYRSARRDGRGLYDAAAAIDAVVAGHFPGSAFVTGVLTELDVRSGRLRYVNAGHPPPLLLREGRVVKSLRYGRRPPLGLGNPELTVGEEFLQPGDWLALYTDGITEGRDARGTWFGEERLVDFLTQALAAGRPPPETVRRLSQAVVAHQSGLLQDDASILLACWSKDPSPDCVDASTATGRTGGATALE
jgi:serine phosphatase RsbU (regulator of sigma subunit)